MHGRGELCSPAGVQRTPLRINKFDPQKTNNKPRQIKKSVGVYFILLDKFGLTYSISVRIVNTLGRLKISFFKNNG